MNTFIDRKERELSHFVGTLFEQSCLCKVVYVQIYTGAKIYTVNAMIKCKNFKRLNRSK